MKSSVSNLLENSNNEFFELVAANASDVLYKFKEQFDSCIPFLHKSNLLNPVMLSWLRCEFLEALGASRDYGLLEINSDDAKKASIAWASSQWGHRIESIYLSEKKSYDRATFSILSVKDQCLALELYHRLKAKESTFQSLSMKYNEGKEWKNGGRYENQRMSNVPTPLQPLLRKMSDDTILKPHRISEWFFIIKLEKFIPAQFDETMQELLLSRELDRLLLSVQKQILAGLELK